MTPLDVPETPVVNAANLQLCLAALRSGDYPQASGTLRRDEGWCCLGVMTDMYHKVTGDGKWERLPDGWWVFILPTPSGGTARHSAVLPPQVQQWLGLPASNPGLPPRTVIIGVNDDVLTTAGSLNDKGVPFTEIADKFEAQYLAGSVGSAT